jgi:uncharacterized protein (TIGR03083 family)
MTSPADAKIAALRSGHDELAALVSTLPAEDLTGPSTCAEWDVSQVLSHLGSGAEIGLGSLQRALDPSTESIPNEEIWDRWNAMSPADRTSGFLAADEALVSAYEALDDTTRNDLRIDLGFLPEPVDVATSVNFRLNEFALHSWDVRSVYDPTATVAGDAAAELVDQSGALIGWIGRGNAIEGTVTVRIETTEPARTFLLGIADQVNLDPVSLDQGGLDQAAADATLTLPAEAWLRLTSGRLAPEWTPASVSVEGATLSLEDLRRVFPGY